MPPFPLRFDLPQHIKCLRVHREMGSNWGDGYWLLWLTANADFTLGTFIQLLDTGEINRVTWHEDCTESVFQVKE